jgi:hypothetical protein
MGEPILGPRNIVVRVVGRSGPQRRESNRISADALGEESGWRVFVCGVEGRLVALREVEDGAEPSEEEGTGL